MTAAVGVGPMPHASTDEADTSPIMAQAAAENFPVASRLIPRRYRDHLLAIYGYCRLVDDIGDEMEGDREAALDWAATELEAAFAGTARHPVFVRLTPTISDCDLAPEPFLNLITANRLDQEKSSYASYRELVGYCELSANPVGRLVLGIFGASSAATVELSDQVCTALQLVEHLQDVAEDWNNGRVYLPADDMARFGVMASELAASTTSPGLRRLVAFESSRAQELLDQGSVLLGALRGSARVAVAGFVGGGLAQLEALRAASFDVLGTTVKASRRAVVGSFFHQYVRARR